MPAGKKVVACPSGPSYPLHTVLNGISSGNEITDVRRLGEPQNTLEASDFSSSHTAGQENWPVESEDLGLTPGSVRSFLPALPRVSSD